MPIVTITSIVHLSCQRRLSSNLGISIILQLFNSWEEMLREKNMRAIITQREKAIWDAFMGDIDQPIMGFFHWKH